MIATIYKRIKAETPLRFRRLGNAMLMTATFVGGGGLIAFDQLEKVFSTKELKVMIGVVLIVGVVGKFITSLFTDEVKPGEDK